MLQDFSCCVMLCSVILYCVTSPHVTVVEATFYTIIAISTALIYFWRMRWKLGRIAEFRSQSQHRSSMESMEIWNVENNRPRIGPQEHLGQPLVKAKKTLFLVAIASVVWCWIMRDDSISYHILAWHIISHHDMSCCTTVLLYYTMLQYIVCYDMDRSTMYHAIM